MIAKMKKYYERIKDIGVKDPMNYIYVEKYALYLAGQGNSEAA